MRDSDKLELIKRIVYGAYESGSIGMKMDTAAEAILAAIDTILCMGNDDEEK